MGTDGGSVCTATPPGWRGAREALRRPVCRGTGFAAGKACVAARAHPWLCSSASRALLLCARRGRARQPRVACGVAAGSAAAAHLALSRRRRRLPPLPLCLPWRAPSSPCSWQPSSGAQPPQQPRPPARRWTQPPRRRPTRPPPRSRLPPSPSTHRPPWRPPAGADGASLCALCRSEEAPGLATPVCAPLLAL